MYKFRPYCLCRGVSVYIDFYKKSILKERGGAEIVEKAIILEKQALVDTISESMQNAKSTVIVEYRGVSVAKLEELRRELRKENVTMKVYKNTLVERASNKLGLDLDAELVGPNAFVFSYEDAVSAPRILAKFAKKEKNLIVKGGIVEGKVISAQEMAAVSKLPSREGLYSMLLSCLQAPIRNFACAVKAVAEKE